MISLMNLTVDMLNQGLSYLEVMMMQNLNAACAGTCVSCAGTMAATNSMLNVSNHHASLLPPFTRSR